MNADVDVVVVGAGPTGLLLAGAPGLGFHGTGRHGMDRLPD